MRFATYVSSITGGIVTALVAIAFWLWPSSTIYQEGKLSVGILTLCLGLFVIVMNVYYLFKEREVVE